jgi:hypothetical protein
MHKTANPSLYPEEPNEEKKSTLMQGLYQYFPPRKTNADPKTEPFLTLAREDFFYQSTNCLERI